jgi:hypothetical protein
MSYDFTHDDLPILNAVMRAFPQVEDGFRAMVELSSRLSFPVESPEVLYRAVAKVGSIRYGDSQLPIEALPTLMPAYYFPIESIEDFVSKVSDVTSRFREPDGPGLTAARLREAVAPRRAEEPTISDHEIRRQADVSDAPGVGGIRKRKG